MKNLKPFDLGEALSGKAVMLRDGRKVYVRQHRIEPGINESRRLVGYGSTRSYLAWCPNGRWFESNTQSNRDIIGMWPEARTINGFEVPEPETKDLEMGSTYFVPHLLSDNYFERLSWDGDDIDMLSLERGVVFLNKEDAIATTKAMLGIDPHTQEV